MIPEIPRQSNIELEKYGVKVSLEFLGGVGDKEKGVSLSGSAIKLNIITKAGEKNILIDFGMFQGGEKDLEYNETIPFDLEKIDNILLTHTHIDHIGKLLHLSKDKFDGTIWTTKLNREILFTMLSDVIKLQDKNEDKKEILKNKIQNYKSLLEDLKKYGDNNALVDIELMIEDLEKELGNIEEDKEEKEFFDEEDLLKLLSKVNSVNYYEKVEISNGIELSFISAGHLPGSSQIILKIEGKEGRQLKIGFSGDLGKFKNPAIWGEPDISKEELDLFVIESTYAGREHNDFLEEENKLIEKINETIKKGGKIIIPVFMQGRAQEMMLYLNKLIEERKVPNIPIFYHSKSIEKILEIYKRNLKEVFSKLQIGKNIKKALTGKGKNKQENFKKYKSSAILIASGGMMDGGTIGAYLDELQNSKNLFISTGYQAEGTKGNKIFIAGEKQIDFGGEIGLININCDLHNFRGFSGHGDESDLLYLISKMKFSPEAKIIINHGEYSRKQLLFGKKIEEIQAQVQVILADFNEEKYIKND